jgi:hypothetical protein
METFHQKWKGDDMNQEKVRPQSPAAIGTRSVSATREKDGRKAKTREMTSGGRLIVFQGRTARRT